MASSDAMMASRKKRRGGGNPIHLDPSKKGSLHTALGIPQGQPIPTSTLRSKLAGNPSPNMRKKLQFALTARTSFRK